MKQLLSLFFLVLSCFVCQASTLVLQNFSGGYCFYRINVFPNCYYYLNAWNSNGQHEIYFDTTSYGYGTNNLLVSCYNQSGSDLDDVPIYTNTMRGDQITYLICNYNPVTGSGVALQTFIEAARPATMQSLMSFDYIDAFIWFWSGFGLVMIWYGGVGFILRIVRGTNVYHGNSDI